jgi:MoxR-like ATPase
MVIATQNPVEQQGTFPLPEAQLDRFLFKVKMGYPTKEEGLGILKRFMTGNPLDGLKPVAGPADIEEAQNAYASVQVSDELLHYLLGIVEATRTHPDAALGVSPRGSQALLRASQAHAALRGRDFVEPGDVKEMAVPVLAHRLVVRSSQRLRPDAAEQLVASIVNAVEVPSDAPLAARS